MSFRIRAAADDDLPAITRIGGHYVVHSVANFDLQPSPQTAWAHKLAEIVADGLPFLVAEAEGAVVGYSYASPWRVRPGYRYTVEDSVYIAPEALRQGLGRQLLGALIEACESIGKRQMVAVIVVEGGEASVALHRAFGFREVGVLEAVGFKEERWLDTVLMQRALGDGAATPVGPAAPVEVSE